MVDWRRIRRPLGDVPSAFRSPPPSLSGLRCGRESRRPRRTAPVAASSAAESGERESRCVCNAATSDAAGSASGERNGRDPRRPVLPPVGIPLPQFSEMNSIECSHIFQCSNPVDGQQEHLITYAISNKFPIDTHDGFKQLIYSSID